MMPRPKLNLHQRVRDILSHVEEMPAEAGAPLAHLMRSSNDLWTTLRYVERKVEDSRESAYESVWRRHSSRLHGLIFIGLVEAFERFLKEVAATCVDRLARFIADDRWDVFRGITGGVLASHFEAGSLGKALCESDTWLDCGSVNKRFRRLLAFPFDDPAKSFELFSIPPNRDDYDTLELIWQLRHSVVHNVGVM
jgi:hypothetical protein